MDAFMPPSPSGKNSLKSRDHLSSIMPLSGFMSHTTRSGGASIISVESPENCICQPSWMGDSSLRRR